MHIRKAASHEYSEIYKQGYQEWPKGRTLEQYIEDNQKEEEKGIRYVLVDENDDIKASLMLLELKPGFYGIGSIVVDPAERGRGLGSKLIRSCLNLYPDGAFMLFSEINPSYYEQFGFRALPAEFQRHTEAVCMVKAGGQFFDKLLQEPLPDYF